MRELETGVFERASQAFADILEKVITIGDLVGTSLTVNVLIPMAGLFEDTAGRTERDEVLVVESVGSAVFDAVTAGQ